MKSRKKTGSLAIVTYILTTLLLITIFVEFIHAKIQTKILIEYYDAIINEDYEKAFKNLLLWSDYNGGTTDYTESEAKNIYLNRLNSLKQQNGYRVLKASFVRKKHDGIPYFMADVVTEVNGKIIYVKDLIKFKKNKFYIESTNDEYGHFRDGKLKNWEGPDYKDSSMIITFLTI